MAENKKYLDLAGLSYFWTKVKGYVDGIDALKVDKTTTINGQALKSSITLTGVNITVGGEGAHNDSNVAKAINDLDVAIKAVNAKAGVVSFGGQTGAIAVDTVGTGAGSVKFAMSGQKLTGTVTGFGDLATKAELNSAKDALNTAIGKKADQTALDAANVKITALENGKADKTEAVGSIKAVGSASATASNVTASVKITPVSISGDDLTPVTASIAIPAAGEAACGVVTLKTIKDLAAAAATSTYKVKGSKESLAAVLAVSSAAVGDVYNITTQFNLNGEPYPAGTNVVFIGHGENEGTDDPKQQIQWDALGGTVDLSPYATNAALEKVKGDLNGRIDGVDGKVVTLSGTVGGHTTEIANLKKADEGLGGRISTLEAWKGTTTTKLASLDSSIATLTEADKKLGERIGVLEAWKGAPLTESEIDTIFAPVG